MAVPCAGGLNALKRVVRTLCVLLLVLRAFGASPQSYTKQQSTSVAEPNPGSSLSISRALAATYAGELAAAQSTAKITRVDQPLPARRRYRHLVLILRHSLH